MSLPKPITEQEREEIRESVLRATGRVELEGEAIRDWRKMVRRESVLPRQERLQNRMLFSLTCADEPDLRLKPIPAVILNAVKTNDTDFFIRLGRVLARQPAKLKRYKEFTYPPPPPRLVKFLLSHWAEPLDGLPELFCLSPEGLSSVCTHHLRVSVSPYAVTKWRQRHGLKVFKRKKIQVLLVGSKLKFL